MKHMFRLHYEIMASFFVQLYLKLVSWFFCESYLDIDYALNRIFSPLLSVLLIATLNYIMLFLTKAY